MRVRYQEVDCRTWCSTPTTWGGATWPAPAGCEEALGWTGVGDDVDWMLVKASIEWQGSATYGDDVDIDCGIGRWGTTSFDVATAAPWGSEPVFTATITYVCVNPAPRGDPRSPTRLRDRPGAAPGA
jgi:hypothetical protein